MLCLLLLVVPCVLGGTLKPRDPVNIEPLGTGTGNDQYEPIDSAYYNPHEVYKAGDKDDCHPVKKLVYADKCVPYVKKTCYTQQKELCKDVFEKNCTAVIDEFEERECFDVTELVCQLAESIQFEMVDEIYTVQRCTKVNDRVCDTAYDLAVVTKDDFQCVDLEHQYCWEEEKVVKDRVCVFSVDFDCGKFKPKDGKGSVTCQKVPTKKCYDTPRKVKEDLCQQRKSKWCEKFSNDSPVPVEKQNCHSEPMKKCESETRSRPKKAKQYVYTKECKPVARQVCESQEHKKLRTTCDKIQKKVCSYKPEEKCEEEKKEYCYKVEKMVWEKVCIADKKDIVDSTFNYV